MYVIEDSEEGLDYRRRYRGLIGVGSKVPIRDRSILGQIYTPGVADACMEIVKHPEAAFEITSRGNTVAMVTDGSDLFGRAGGPPEAALPILESKSVLFKTFAGIDAFPICLDQLDPFEIVNTVNALSPTFGAFCIDDISTPRAFTIADHLEKASTLPVFSNQYHGAGILVLGGLINAAKVTGRKLEDLNVVVAGAGVSGIGVARLLRLAGVKSLVACDSSGAIYPGRPHGMNWAKSYLAKETNRAQRSGSLAEMLIGADVFIGLSTGGIVTADMIRSMAADPIVMALSIPDPEIEPLVAADAGAAVVATGRSDFPNQMDISLVFPGVFRGLLDSGARNIRLRMLLGAARALAGLVPEEDLHRHNIVPHIFDFRVASTIAAVVVEAANETGESRRKVSPGSVAKRTHQYVYEGVLHPLSLLTEDTGEVQGDPEEGSLGLRRRHGGILEVRSKIPIKDHHILNMLYLPPAALAPAAQIREDPMSVYELTIKGNVVAIVTDGSAVLGLGDIGARAALPVMEGKAVLFQALAGVEAFPICVNERDPGKIADIVRNIAPSFGAINLEDISAPRCFEVERLLSEQLDLPVFHDDQHGTAVVVLAALINALKLRRTAFDSAQVVINGAGAAGISVGRLLLEFGIGDLIVCDRQGVIHPDRRSGMNPVKEQIAAASNQEGLRGDLATALRGADVFIGLSAPGALTTTHVESMCSDPIVFALANPVPEIAPELATSAGALVTATGRSDYPNQVNNSLAFPGVFRGALDTRASSINQEMKVAAATAIAELVTSDELAPHYIIPEALDLRVAPAVAAAVARAAIETGVARLQVDPATVAERTREMIYGLNGLHKNRQDG